MTAPGTPVIHRHVWKIVEKVEHPAPLEQMTATGKTFDFFPQWVFEREIVVRAYCERCGTEKVYRA